VAQCVLVRKADITPELVRRLVATQFPQWAELPVRPVDVDGWDNATFRLGERMSVRLPSSQAYVEQVSKEHCWLPFLAPQLPLPIPEPLAMGEPGCGFPRPWSVYRWIDGRTAAAQTVASLPEFAADLAGFLAALYKVDPSGGPVPGTHNFFRGRSPACYDAETRAALARCAVTSTPAWPARSGRRRWPPGGTVRQCGSMAMPSRATCSWIPPDG
jgi:aminoglycoside phosphotransferase (APT) family kinase protein